MSIPQTEIEKKIVGVFGNPNLEGATFMGYPITKMTNRELQMALVASYSDYCEKKYYETLTSNIDRLR